jgi:asparagine synthase (glutamine-hydrolysing)
VQRSIGDWVRAKHTRIFDEDIDEIFQDAPPFEDVSGFFSYDGFSQDETANWLRWNEFVAHLSMVLLKVDRASMFSSLEVRVPLLDMSVVELACRIHWKDCLDIDGGIGKLPLRKCLSRYVPKQSVDKKGFTVPMGDWLRGPLRSLVEDVLLKKQSLLGLAIHRNALRKFFESHCSGHVDRAWGIWVLLSLALWEERYLKSSS